MSKIEDNVCKKIQDRAKVGFRKYGQTMERTDLSYLDWLIYLQEELMDSLVYLERIIEEEKERISKGYPICPDCGETLKGIKFYYEHVEYECPNGHLWSWHRKELSKKEYEKRINNK